MTIHETPAAALASITTSVDRVWAIHTRDPGDRQAQIVLGCEDQAKLEAKFENWRGVAVWTGAAALARAEAAQLRAERGHR